MSYKDAMPYFLVWLISVLSIIFVEESFGLLTAIVCLVCWTMVGLMMKQGIDLSATP